MDWNKYKADFRQLAIGKGKDESYCTKWLYYAEKLFKNELPIIYDQRHLCALVGYKEEYLYAASNAPERFYRHYQIPKKSGGFREISEPLPSLKEIQRWILDNILTKTSVSIYAKAYIKKKSIKENARFHKRQKIVLSLDIEHFFDNIKSDKIFDVFKNLGYEDDVVVMLTNLCCLREKLPQGSPTSPVLSNIILTDFDNRVGNFTNKNKIRYTRYADDMTFSGDFNPGQVISFVRNSLFPLGFKLNQSKTRTRGPGQRQEVTGIVVNEKTQLPREKRKKIRQEVYYIKKYGLESHMNYCKISKENYLLHLKGLIQHGLFINKKDIELKSYIEFLEKKY